MAELRTRSSDGSTNVVLISDAPVRIGRSPHNHIVVDEDRVSSIHLAVWATAGVLYAEDLGSKNGSTLNGEALVGAARVKDGDELSLGGVVQVAVVGVAEETMPPSLGAPHEWAVSTLKNFVDIGGTQNTLHLLTTELRAVTGATKAWAVALERRGADVGYAALAPAEARDQVPAPMDFGDSPEGKALAGSRAVWREGLGVLPIGSHAVLHLSGPADGEFSTQARAQVEALCTVVGSILDRERSVLAGGTQLLAEPLPGLVGGSIAMADVYELARAFAPMPWPMLLLGETGTGKTAVARAIHELSGRKDRRLVERNCATIPLELAESTLFGHERGAFTGAVGLHEGWVGEVGEGTLFLDEIGELPPSVQAKMLTLIQDGRYVRVGGRTSLPFRGRIIAATNRAIDRGEDDFRRDLFSRLAACVVRIPPLRQRGVDIPALARHLFRKNCQGVASADGLTLSEQAVSDLMAREYREGNLRELENLLRLGIARAIAGGERRVLPSHFKLPTSASALDNGADAGLEAATNAFQKAMVLRALAGADWQMAAAAKELGVSRQALYRVVERLEIDVDGFRSA